MKEIKKFRGDYFFLSNFYEVPVKYEDLVYKSAEAAYQAAKTFDQEIRRLFTTISAKEAKTLGRQLSLREDWEDVKAQVMSDVIFAKFRDNKDIQQRLIATNDARLVEGNDWHDNTFGACSCRECKDIEKQNLLGETLMYYRDNFFKENNNG